MKGLDRILVVERSAPALIEPSRHAVDELSNPILDGDAGPERSPQPRRRRS